MKPAAFEYHVPSSAKEAACLLAELGDSATVIAGGQSLVPLLALRLAVFDHLIDIGRIRRSGLIADRVPLLARRIVARQADVRDFDALRQDHQAHRPGKRRARPPCRPRTAARRLRVRSAGAPRSLQGQVSND